MIIFDPSKNKTWEERIWHQPKEYQGQTNGLGNVIVTNEEPSIYADREELVKILVHRCKKLDEPDGK